MHYGDVDISGGSKTTLVGVTTRSSGLSFMSIRHVNTERPTARLTFLTGGQSGRNMHAVKRQCRTSVVTLENQYTKMIPLQCNNCYTTQTVRVENYDGKCSECGGQMKPRKRNLIAGVMG